MVRFGKRSALIFILIMATSSLIVIDFVPYGLAQSNTNVLTLSFDCESMITNLGYTVDFGGNLLYNGIGLSGAQIQFSYRLVGETTWQNIGSVNTGTVLSAGGFFFAWAPPSFSQNYVLNASWAGNSTYPTVNTIVNFEVIPFNNQDQNIFSVASNSTLTSLVFDSTNELTFSISGPSGTTGYAKVCIPKLLLSQPQQGIVKLDGITIGYDYQSISSYCWQIAFKYNQTSHDVVIALGSSPTTTPTQTSSPAPSPSSIPTTQSTPSSPPTVPEFSWLALLPLLVILLSVVAIIKQRKI